MYKLHLILKYLRKRRIAWVSLVAVMLCTAMVLVVISVMGGWLRMFQESVRGLSADVVVLSESPAGFEHYGQIIERLEALPEVEAAVPVIRTFGLVKIAHLDPMPVQVVGYPIEQIGQVNRFGESLHRHYQQYLEQAEDPTISRDERARLLQRAEQAQQDLSFDLPLPPERYRAALAGARGDPAQWPGMIVGSSVVGIRRDKDGSVVGRTDIMYEVPVTLITMGISPGAFTVDMGDMARTNYWIVDDSRQISPIELPPVYVPFDVLQVDLGMEQRVETLDGEPIFTRPARTSELQIRVADGVELLAARGRIEQVVHGTLLEQGVHEARLPAVRTWQQRHANWLDQIEKEKVLLVFLFGIISLVAVFLIFAIFYMIVVEKTKDIGIIKSVGASSGGVAGIFLGYGMAIGLVGTAMGLALGFVIVRNINWLHEQLAYYMEIEIWSAEFYLFDTIPNTMNPAEVVVIVAVAIVASVIGALVPAIRAARMNPVESLRWE